MPGANTYITAGSIGATRSQYRARAVAVGILLAVALTAWWPVLRAGFIWDDDDYVTKNPTLTDAPGLARIWGEPGAVPQYYPLVHTGFWVERHLWGLRPLGYHLVNLILHLLAAVLLWMVLKRLSVPGAWVAASVFALHPLQVESVAWVTERKNVLSAAFYFAALLAWLRFRPIEAPSSDLSGHPDRNGHAGPSGHPDPNRRSGADRRYYAAALALFVCALLSKTVTGSLPVAILIILWWKRGRIERRDLTAMVPFFVLALIMGSVTIWMERRHVGAVGSDWDLSFLQRCLIAGRVIWFYIGKLLWPSGLSFVYTRWTVDSRSVGQYLYPVTAALVGTGLWIVSRRGSAGRSGGASADRAPLAAVLFYAVTLFPALGFVNVFPMRYSFVADHFAYLASLGPIVLITGSVAHFLGSRGPAHFLNSRARPGDAPFSARRLLTPATALAAAVILVLAFCTHRRATVYETPETLWRDTLARNPQAWMARHNLGKLYEDEGRTTAAIEEYRQALRIRPDLDQSLYNLGNDLAQLGRTDEAVAALSEALRINPRFVEARNNLGNALHKRGDLEGAIAQYRKAVELDPTYAAALRNLAFALAEQGNAGEAVRVFRQAIDREPEDLPTRNRLAWLLATSRDASVRNGPEAVALAEELCRASRYGNPGYLATLAAAQAECGRFDGAVATVQRAIGLAQSAGRSEMIGTLQAQAGLYNGRRTLAAEHP